MVIVEQLAGEGESPWALVWWRMYIHESPQLSDKHSFGSVDRIGETLRGMDEEGKTIPLPAL